MQRTEPATTTQKVTCHRKPVAPCEILPHGLDGLVSIGARDYLLSYHATLPEVGPVEVLGYRFFVCRTGQSYDIPADLSNCECPDFHYKRHACKHIVCLLELREQGDVA